MPMDDGQLILGITAGAAVAGLAIWGALAWAIHKDAGRQREQMRRRLRKPTGG